MSQFIGCGTALVTPFLPDLSLDEVRLRALVRRQIEAGVHFLVPCGTTGESPTITLAEHLRVVEITLEEAKGKCPVLAGAGGYYTAEVIELAQEIEKLGADGILSVTPYYNRPTQEGLYQHYRAIASAIGLPIMLYNVAGRTGVNIEPATMRRLAAIDNIIGVKEASGSVAQMAHLCATLPEEFDIVSGDRRHRAGARRSRRPRCHLCSLERNPGAHGAPGAGVPRRRLRHRAGAAEALAAADGGQLRRIQPIPVKAALARMGLLEPVWRLPLVPPQPASQARIEAVLKDSELI